MRHNSKKIKVQLGKDANKMLMRKLAISFLTAGKLTTTEKKAKLLKTHIERIVEKTKKKSESNKNFLLKYLAHPKLIESLFTTVGSVMADRIGGYVRMQKLAQRYSDGTLMIRLEWTTPVVLEKQSTVIPSAEKASEKMVKPEKKNTKKSTKV